VDFKLSPAVGGDSSAFNCHNGICDEEKYFLCAQETIGARVHCLAAMDKSKGTLSERAQACAAAEGADFDEINACFNGDQGNTLLTQANVYYEAVKSQQQITGIPWPLIDGEHQSDRSYTSLLNALCAKGISAGACKEALLV